MKEEDKKTIGKRKKEGRKKKERRLYGVWVFKN